MFETCILHIGTEKTGTTSIQALMGSNTQALRRQGLHYPAAFGSGGQRDIATCVMDDGLIDDARQALGISTPDHIARHRAAVAGKLARITEKFSARFPTLLLSSEHFHSRLNTPQAVARLKDLLAPHCRDFRVLVFLRPQHELAVSIYSTRLRVGAPAPEIIPKAKRPLPYYDYRALLDRWTDTFGRAAVSPRIYSRDVLDAFLTYCGIDRTALTAPRRINEALSGEAQAFLAGINPHLGSERGDIARYLNDIGSLPGPQPARAEAEAFDAVYAEGNEAVRAEWFPDRARLFECDLSHLPETRREISLDPETLFALFGAIWRAKIAAEQGAGRGNGQAGAVEGERE